MSEGIRGERRPRVASLVFASLLAACWQGSSTGPEKIHWNRQTCEHCQMVISEQRHAVQIRRLGERRTHAFDDLGCALLWLDEQGLLGGGERDPEIWVKEPTALDWVDAREQRFAGGLSTPMAYGFGVAEQGIGLDAVAERVLAAERNRRLEPTEPARNRADPRDREKGGVLD